MTRQLATIRIIDEIRPIEGADAIECAVVGGWTVVVKRGEFKAGDAAIYFEIDSFIPTEIAPFLSRGKEPKEYNGIKGERLRTVKLRKQISQGLLLPYTNFPEVVSAYHQTRIYDGTDFDVTELLGIVKYDPPVPAQLAGIAKGNWPVQIPKTDEPRIQNMTKSFSRLQQHKYEVTEKLEGSSCTVSILDNEFIVCSRNINLQETEDNTFWKVARSYNVEERMRSLGLNNLAIQGELIGPGVQGNIYKLDSLEFHVFSVFDVEQNKYLQPSARRELCAKLGLSHAPVIDEEFDISGLTVENLLDIANGSSVLHNTAREGLVFKRVDGDEHFKVISNVYLLNEK